MQELDVDTMSTAVGSRVESFTGEQMKLPNIEALQDYKQLWTV